MMQLVMRGIFDGMEVNWILWKFDLVAGAYILGGIHYRISAYIFTQLLGSRRKISPPPAINKPFDLVTVSKL